MTLRSALPGGRRGFVLLLALQLHSAAWALPAAPHELPDPRVLVLYQETDPPLSGQYDQILRGIQSQSAIRVVSLQLAYEQILALNGSRPSRLGNMLAMADGQIAVVYPDIGDPYRGIFTKIIEGIEAKAKRPVFSLAVGSHQNIDELRSLLKSKDVRVVIALGRQGMQTADDLGNEFGVVVGGVNSVPEGNAKHLSVTSLSPDPALLFTRLKSLIPSAKRVFVVYDPKQNGWLLRLARSAARNQGLELVAYEAQDLKSAIARYQQILASADPNHDALWLPQDSTTVEDGVVLPMVLKEAWNSALPVFSSSLAHVKRGVLFSLYPDNLGLGQGLASSALDFLESGEPANLGLSPLKDVQTAVNLRTARHLGLSFSSQLQRSFGAVFADQ